MHATVLYVVFRTCQLDTHYGTAKRAPRKYSKAVAHEPVVDDTFIFAARVVDVDNDVAGAGKELSMVAHFYWNKLQALDTQHLHRCHPAS